MTPDEITQKQNRFLQQLNSCFSAVYSLSLQDGTYEELQTDRFLGERISPKGTFSELYRQLFGPNADDSTVFSLSTVLFQSENHTGVLALSPDKEEVYDYRILRLSPNEGALMLMRHAAVSDDNRYDLLKEEIQKINNSKNMFISNMSHEIRTPINAVLGMGEMILREATDPQILSYATDIRNAGQLLLSVINDILDFSKIESGVLKVIPEEYQTTTMLTDIATMISVRMKEKELSFVTDIDPRIPSILFGDELRIKQVILNLLTNAVKYTDHGTITLSVHYLSLEGGTPALKIAVRDTGIGMRKEDIKYIFNAYERLEEKENLHIAGTGLGISIIVRLLEQMNSKLEVESEFGKGSVFSFVLPQQIIRNTPIGELKLGSETIAPPSGSQSFFAPTARVLAVDDNRVNLTVLKGLLKKTGIVPDCVQSGRECLLQLQKKNYDIIFLDHLMPEMDGIETLHRIRNTEGINRNIPIVALTANIMYGAKERYISAGFTDFIEKPIRAELLEKILAAYLPIDCIEST